MKGWRFRRNFMGQWVLQRWIRVPDLLGLSSYWKDATQFDMQDYVEEQMK